MPARSPRPRTRKPSPDAALDVVCFGEVLWDVFEAKPVKDEAIGREFVRMLGGAPANVATGLARLGAKAAVVGGLGADRFGDALVQHLERDDVDTRFLSRMPNRTGITFVTRDAEGEPSFLFYRHESADLSIKAEQITPEMGRARWALVGTSTMMTPSLAAATERFLAVAKEGGAHVVVDLNVREHLWTSKAEMRAAIARLVAHASLVKGSFADLVAITGRRDILWLADHAPRAAWLVTQGAKGASAIGDHGFLARPAERAKCVDATGGGDAFLAGALAVLLRAGAVPGSAAWREPATWAAALEVGHAMGAKAVSGVGAVTALTGLEKIRARLATIQPMPEPKPVRAPAPPKAKPMKKKPAKPARAKKRAK